MLKLSQKWFGGAVTWQWPELTSSDIRPNHIALPNPTPPILSYLSRFLFLEFLGFLADRSQSTENKSNNTYPFPKSPHLAVNQGVLAADG